MAICFLRRIGSMVTKPGAFEDKLCLHRATGVAQFFASGVKSFHKGEPRPSSSQHGRKGREKIRLGVVGCGRISFIHVPNILSSPRIELSWIVDNNADQMNTIKEKFFLQDVPAFELNHIDELLDDKRLHGILVLSSTSTHTDYVCRALKKGKAVFVEKPAGESAEDIKLCYDTAQKYNTPLVTGFNRRFDATFSSLHESYNAGVIGDPMFIKLTSRDCPKPSYDFLQTCDITGCNIISDLAIHDIDTLVWLTEAEKPESIFVQTHAHDKILNDMGVDDALMIMLKYKNGLIASIDVVRESAYGYDIRVEMFGNKGMLTTDPQREISLRTDSAGKCETSSMLYSFSNRFAQAYSNELEHFVRCIEGSDVPLITGKESLMTADIVEKGVQSWSTKSVVYFD